MVDGVRLRVSVILFLLTLCFLFSVPLPADERVYPTETPSLSQQCQLLSPEDEGAVAVYRRGATQGLLSCLLKLGYVYENGIRIKRSLNKAKHWYREAARKGHRVAQFRLGDLLYKQKGNPGSESEAYMWFHKSARLGYPPAQTILGAVFKNGELGQEKDLRKRFTGSRKPPGRETDWPNFTSEPFTGRVKGPPATSSVLTNG